MSEQERKAEQERQSKQKQQAEQWLGQKQQAGRRLGQQSEEWPKQQFERTAMLLGASGMDRLKSARVAVFGIGGVGGYVCEALVRSGVGAIDLIDHDQVSVSNLNRQIIATRKTIGRDKVDVMRERILEINPEVRVRIYKCFLLPENADTFPFAEYDYVVDAVDTVTAKIELVLRAQAAGIPMISSMGTGNKLDGGGLRVGDIYQTSVCPLARVMRRELKKRGVERLKVVYSEETPLHPSAEAACADVRGEAEEAPGRKQTPGSVAFVPSAAGLMIAGEVVKDLIKD